MVDEGLESSHGIKLDGEMFPDAISCVAIISLPNSGDLEKWIEFRYERMLPFLKLTIR